MKWHENGTEFEGTPAEYAELHAALHGGCAAPDGRKQRVQIAPIHGRAVRCTGSTGYRDFVNAKEAWEYTVQQTGLRVSYSTFCKAAASGMSIGGVRVEYTEPARSSKVKPASVDELPMQQVAEALA